MTFLPQGIRSYFRKSEIKRILRDPGDPLNYSDQEKYIRSRIRRLDYERYLDLMKSASPLLLLGAGATLLVMRRYRAGSLTLAAFLAQEIWKGLQSDTDLKREQQKWSDRELERYAMKLERGDYGKHEVIPFR